MAVKLAVGQKLDLTLKLTPAESVVDGIPNWVSGDEAIGTLTVGEDGMSATFEALGAGAVTITATADAAPGDAVETLTATLELEVSAQAAESMDIEAGEPYPA